jgi:periplasmic divalent cation tolerance protein
LEKLILAAHPYDTPEFIVVPLTAGTPRYLKWIEESTAAADSDRRRAGIGSGP